MTITATIIKDSINANGVRITTMEIEYPRFIHAEVMTHRMFSRNSASSRAIPTAKVMEQIRDNPAMPIHWGKNQAGMQAKEELSGVPLSVAKYTWIQAAMKACDFARDLNKCEAHKQIVNRLLEPFQTMKVIVTATEWNNFWWLRDHPDAQPEIQKLARVMKGEYDKSKPVYLEYGMWHLPYVTTTISEIAGVPAQFYFDEQGNAITLDQAIHISCSCCAQVSYRKLDTSLEKAEDIYKKLVESEPVHASAFEHVARCSEVDYEFDPGDFGWTHVDFQGNHWSGNFRDWVQYRQLIPNHSMKG